VYYFWPTNYASAPPSSDITSLIFPRACLEYLTWRSLNVCYSSRVEIHLIAPKDQESPLDWLLPAQLLPTFAVSFSFSPLGPRLSLRVSVAFAYAIKRRRIITDHRRIAGFLQREADPHPQNSVQCAPHEAHCRSQTLRSNCGPIVVHVHVTRCLSFFQILWEETYTLR